VKLRKTAGARSRSSGDQATILNAISSDDEEKREPNLISFARENIPRSGPE